MIIDDSYVLRKLLSLGLKGFDYSIFEAEDGLDALEKLNYISPDLIIVDLNMPKMDGLEFIKTLRSNYRFLDIPVIMLTTSKDEEIKKEALHAGVNLFLTKPIKPEILLYKIKSLLGEG